MLPSDEWLVIDQHWHGYAGPFAPERPPDVVLRDPYAVATWIARHSDAAHLWNNHFLVASRGDTIRHHELTAAAVTDDQCLHGCTGRP